jgi:ATPase subunit of ABC transporter with duplicated ATPase domains
MSIISLSNVSFSYDASNIILDNVSAVFNDFDCVAIVGDNGSGKTTLLKLLAGDIVPDAGHVARNASVYMLNQINAHDAKSGGERQSAELRRAFASGAAILLLDEPTNNLDTDARARFFDELASYPFGAVIVSHDRELLQKMDKIIEIADGHLRIYGGNYDFYVAQKRAEQAAIYSKYVTAGKKINRLIDTINIAQNTRQHHEAKQKKEIASARRSRLEANALTGKSQETEAKKRAIIQKKIDTQMNLRAELSAQMIDDKIKIPVPNKPFYSKELVQISNLGFGYGANRVFDGFDFSMYGGQRIRITGKNGSGKSTLLKIICGDLKPESGTVKTFGKIAYLNQDLSLLDMDKTVVENIMDIAGVLKHDAHVIAANFGFRGDASNKCVGVLSGGELLKATLASVLGGENQPDLLILDEPTNNLEIKSIAILEDALNQYHGAILLVSHDEMFARNIKVDREIEIIKNHNL